ncbi:2-succinylbenzoate-CoA ligase [Halobellus salinus]|uniref:2-succinylbenzoate--CoA ligase n=1 Tax=Halobellus salinus TaxID=931585 RepID=A0A830EMW2_9EURY|nr:AMP-binding protein [Halobellus salinus]GGJ04365.1 2-succinylbenzoate-CoA ligase [Halobellus salinus]SMP08747.1 O-succinylbenzoic acid--CoA ligase [Halobellus salinus]
MRDWLSHRAGIDPGREALVDTTTDTSYTFGTLDTLVDDLASRLAAVGVDDGTHLGAVLRPCVEYVCLIHAAMRLGATLVPMGDGLTPRELATQLDAADVATVVCDRGTEDAVTAAVSTLGGVNATHADDPGGPITVATVDNAETTAAEQLSTVQTGSVSPASWSLDDTQLLLFTSGTTGDPKPVRLTTGNLLASAAASAFRLGVDPGDRWVATLPLHHTGGISPILRMPVYGMTVVLREEFDAGDAADDLDSYDATAVSLVPTMLRRMLDRRGTLAESLRVVLLGGAPAPTDLIERCCNYSVPVYPTYGMTETASQIATARPEQAVESPERVGSPLFLTEVRVVDEAGSPLSPGESGELVVDGPTVTPGYYGTPAATEAAFGEFGLHTGDVGALDESGSLRVLNRLDDRIVTGGENVNPGAIADVLVDHPDVSEAAVVGVPDAEWGERVSALLVPESGVSPPSAEPDPATGRRLDSDDVLAFARDRLAAYKLPKMLSVAETLPRTVSGTVDRAAVRDRFSPEASATNDGRNGPDQGERWEGAGTDDSNADTDPPGDTDDSNADTG